MSNIKNRFCDECGHALMQLHKSSNSVCSHNAKHIVEVAEVTLTLLQQVHNSLLQSLANNNGEGTHCALNRLESLKAKASKIILSEYSQSLTSNNEASIHFDSMLHIRGGFI